MKNIVAYLLMPVMAFLLVCAQALWGTVIKHQGALKGSVGDITVALISNWRMWAGAAIYIVATLIYFYMLSKLKFFSVQIAMTALSIIFSLGLSAILFHERPSIINILGVVIVFIGIILVLNK